MSAVFMSNSLLRNMAGQFPLEPANLEMVVALSSTQTSSHTSLCDTLLVVEKKCVLRTSPIHSTNTWALHDLPCSILLQQPDQPVDSMDLSNAIFFVARSAFGAVALLVCQRELSLNDFCTCHAGDSNLSPASPAFLPLGWFWQCHQVLHSLAMAQKTLPSWESILEKQRQEKNSRPSSTGAKTCFGCFLLLPCSVTLNPQQWQNVIVVVLAATKPMTINSSKFLLMPCAPKSQNGHGKHLLCLL